MSRTLHLTFDDGPDPRWSTRVLSALRDCRAKATFFVIGERLRAAPEVISTILETGNEVQLHCHRHIRHTDLSEREIERDTGEALAALERFNVRPRYWRTPWGVRTAASARVAERHGLTLVNWTIDTHDWRGDPAAVMLARARAQLADGGVMLMHDGLGPGALRVDCENTVELLRPLIATARSEGIELASQLARPGQLQ